MKLTKELRKLMDEITSLATNLVKEYKEDPPVSGSSETMVQVHHDSPVLMDKQNSKDAKD